MAENNGPTAEDIARAMVKAQAEENAKKGTRLSNVLGWGGMLVGAPAGVALFVLGMGDAGTLVCGGAFVAVIVGAIIGTVSRP